MSAPTDCIDEHDALADVCHCEWCQGSSKLERADAVVAEMATREQSIGLLVRVMMGAKLGGLLS